MIKENISNVNEKIISECNRDKIDPDSVHLIAVSKTKPLEMLKEAYDAGVRDFGENKVQEIVDKFDKMPSDTRFHMIGHLQTNKVKYIADKVYMIHSVDSYKLAAQIDKYAKNCNRIIPILIEVNIADEESKFGIAPSECIDFVKSISTFSNIKISGLMTVAPFTENPESNRAYFRQMKQLSVDITNENIDNVFMNVLSMGMTGDYIVAVSEGATYVRVGTGIFGKRNYDI
ncbi:MAG: YggS family pyridoxal phosphate-dependent enzyme [Lachnospiraceae bacterium]|nr:YggS family pyridoxal phosphate-dependent enzyme [Candidatus Colinaster equi]